MSSFRRSFLAILLGFVAWGALSGLRRSLPALIGRPLISREFDWRLNKHKLTFLQLGSNSTVTVPDGDGQHSYIFIFFNYGDCYAGQADFPFWNQLPSKFDGTVKIIGITSGASPEKLRYFLDKADVRIPILYDSTDQVISELYFRGVRTPARILVDRTGAIRSIDGADYGQDSSQTAYIERVKRVLGALESGRKASGVQISIAQEF